MTDFTDFIFEKTLGPVLLLMLVLLIIYIPIGIWDSIESTNELQTILKNECGMEYSIEEVRKNGENLSRICGLKKN